MRRVDRRGAGIHDMWRAAGRMYPPPPPPRIHDMWRAAGRSPQQDPVIYFGHFHLLRPYQLVEPGWRGHRSRRRHHLQVSLV